MKKRGAKTTYSASDLVAFMGCSYRTHLDLVDLETPLIKAKTDEQVELIQDKGFAHEEAYLQSLRNSGLSLVEIPKDGPDKNKLATTRAAMVSGAQIIFQAALADGQHMGYADFLRRVEAPSLLGDWSYEVIDTKLAHFPKPKFIIQLVFYSELMLPILGHLPENMHLVMGNGAEHSFRVADFSHYYQRLKQRFEAYVAAPLPVKPEQCEACTYCHWRDRCKAEWQQGDHLNRVANINKVQIKRLNKNGIQTLAQLATISPKAALPKMLPDTLHRLRAQAALQLKKQKTGKDQFQMLTPVTGAGLERMPAADAGDLFFDMEGDPLIEGGLEYLFGVYSIESGVAVFRDFWAHDRSAEKIAFCSFIDYVTAHLVLHPNAHIYHYAHYEPTALKRLMSVHGTREAEVDQLLRQKRFVDLYQVVREAVRVSEPRYSIKNLETFYMPKRAGDVTSAGASIVYYEKWRRTRDETLLKNIRDYNEDDCRSTHLLREWLAGLKPQASSKPDDAIAESAAVKSDKIKAHEARLADYEEKLLARLPEAREQWTADDCLRELMFQLLDFHRRAAKPGWWSIFSRCDMSVEELMDDAECIAGLQRIEKDDPEPSIAPNRKIVRYRYPEQDFKIRKGDSILRTDTSKGLGSVFAIDEDRRHIDLSLALNTEVPENISISLGGPLKTDVLTEALFRIADGLIAGDHRFIATFDFLRRTVPRLTARIPGTPVVDAAGDIAQIIDAVLAMDRSTLFIQGPPGSGKTYTGSHLIAELLKRGYRVGVSSNSHKAIHNLLHAVEKRADELGLEFCGVYKSSQTKGSEFDGSYIDCANNAQDVIAALDIKEFQLFAGTAWMFADPSMECALDYLFVDEAGQVATANLLAMATSAHNIVLLGDQMQLGQPVQGTHPGDSGLSSLDYLLQGRATIPPDRGIFLATTWRMHPDVCRFISNAVYEGRLLPEPKNANQRLILGHGAHPTLQATGLRFVPVVHDGCAQKSEEEAIVVAALYTSLLQQRYQDRNGDEYEMTPENILVVAPYNMQVNLLKRHLPEGARVGTVDKFQGQEAEVVIVSMTTSNADSMPRHIEFLFSKNRLNVAISRARSLALLVACPDLADIPCATGKEMELVSTLCHAINVNKSTDKRG